MPNQLAIPTNPTSAIALSQWHLLVDGQLIERPLFLLDALAWRAILLRHTDIIRDVQLLPAPASRNLN